MQLKNILKISDKQNIYDLNFKIILMIKEMISLKLIFIIIILLSFASVGSYFLITNIKVIESKIINKDPCNGVICKKGQSCNKYGNCVCPAKSDCPQIGSCEESACCPCEYPYTCNESNECVLLPVCLTTKCTNNGQDMFENEFQACCDPEAKPYLLQYPSSDPANHTPPSYVCLKDSDLVGQPFLNGNKNPSPPCQKYSCGKEGTVCKDTRPICSIDPCTLTGAEMYVEGDSQPHACCDSDAKPYLLQYASADSVHASADPVYVCLRTSDIVDSTPFYKANKATSSPCQNPTCDTSSNCKKQSCGTDPCTLTGSQMYVEGDSQPHACCDSDAKPYLLQYASADSVHASADPVYVCLRTSDIVDSTPFYKGNKVTSSPCEKPTCDATSSCKKQKCSRDMCTPTGHDMYEFSSKVDSANNKIPQACCDSDANPYQVRILTACNYFCLKDTDLSRTDLNFTCDSKKEISSPCNDPSCTNKKGEDGNGACRSKCTDITTCDHSQLCSDYDGSCYCPDGGCKIKQENELCSNTVACCAGCGGTAFICDAGVCSVPNPKYCSSPTDDNITWCGQDPNQYIDKSGNPSQCCAGTVSYLVPDGDTCTYRCYPPGSSVPTCKGIRQFDLCTDTGQWRPTCTWSSGYCEEP